MVEPTDKKCVLLVEDEPDVLQTLAAILERKGYRVVTACDGQDALQQDKVMTADVVVTDLRMPGIDGLELYFKVMGVRAELPFIFISGHAFRHEDASPAAGLANVVLLQKPFSTEALVQAIASRLK